MNPSNEMKKWGKEHTGKIICVGVPVPKRILSMKMKC